MTEHTPGPWDDQRIFPSGIYGEDVPIYAAGKMIAFVIDNGDEDEKRAIARLIAEAPDVLRAAKAVLDEIEPLWFAQVAALNAQAP